VQGIFCERGRLAAQIIKDRYDPSQWNIYSFHFSDGDNWGTDDSDRCFDLLRNQIFPAANVFCYGQVRSAYGSGKFKPDLDKVFGDEPKLITSDIHDRDGIWRSIKDFLGKGV